MPNKEYLRIEFDIAAGELKGYYRELYNNKGFWNGNFIKSYKDKALPFFKKFIKAVEKSNAQYKWDNNEGGLVGKKIGLVIAEEEYLTKDNEVKIRNYVYNIHDIQQIMNKDYIIPPLKKLKTTSEPSGQTKDFEVIASAPVPF